MSSLIDRRQRRPPPLPPLQLEMPGPHPQRVQSSGGKTRPPSHSNVVIFALYACVFSCGLLSLIPHAAASPWSHLRGHYQPPSSSSASAPVPAHLNAWLGKGDDMPLINTESDDFSSQDQLKHDLMQEMAFVQPSTSAPSPSLLLLNSISSPTAANANARSPLSSPLISMLQVRQQSQSQLSSRSQSQAMSRLQTNSYRGDPYTHAPAFHSLRTTGGAAAGTGADDAILRPHRIIHLKRDPALEEGKGAFERPPPPSFHALPPL